MRLFVVEGEFDDGGEVADAVVDGEVFGGERGGLGCLGDARGKGEVGGGDLKPVEELAGAFGVKLTGGETREHVMQGDLDAGGIVDGRNGKDGGAVAFDVGGGGLLADGSMVVAEVLSAQGGRAATMAVGEDVAAEVTAFGVGQIDDFDGLHDVSCTPPYLKS